MATPNPSEEPGIHDNFLTGYTVCHSTKSIRLKTVYLDRPPVEHTDVLFEGVAIHQFQYDTPSTILFGIEETSAAKFLCDKRNEIELGIKLSGWYPTGWNPEKESLSEFAARLDLKAYEISSSCGMDGWVVAKSMRYITMPNG